MPTENTIGNILNRLNYSLKRVQKKKPLKKVAETDAIFENVRRENKYSDSREDSVRISIDTKAKVNIGAFSRNGKARVEVAPSGLDHDYETQEKLVPFGILNVKNNQMAITFGNSSETSDFIVDGLEKWWDGNKASHLNAKELVINLDNGPSVASSRTQFLHRMLCFSERTGLQIHLVYYPPYHSKYNPIERCWGNLERHWNGVLLDSVQKALKWASSLTWKGVQTVVSLIDKVYQKGVKLTKKEMLNYQSRIKRSETLPKWDVRILPSSG